MQLIALYAACLRNNQFINLNKQSGQLLMFNEATTQNDLKTQNKSIEKKVRKVETIILMCTQYKHQYFSNKKLSNKKL